MPPAKLPIVIETEPLAHDPRRWLNDRSNLVHCPYDDRPALFEQLSNASGLVVRTYTRVDTELLDHAPNLRVVARAGVGLDNIDLDACKARSISVVHTPGANTHAVVEYVASTILNAVRTPNTLDARYAASRWHELRAQGIAKDSCVGKTLGIIGLGRIGSRVADLGHALGMRVLFNDVRKIPSNQLQGSEQVTINQLLQESDIISVHVDGSQSNTRLINQGAFAQLKPNALFINTSRGFVVDPSAALRFAKSNPASQLVLDVHDPEPIETGSAFFDARNITLTAHIASGIEQAKEAMSWVVKDLVRVLNNEPPEYPAF